MKERTKIVLLSENYRTLTPAYGRDYKSQKEIESDFNANKDFILNPDGIYINKEQIKPGTKVQLRYARMMKVHVVTA